MARAPLGGRFTPQAKNRLRRGLLFGLWASAFCLWTLFIWSNSLRVGAASAAQSTHVAGVLAPIFRFFAVHDPALMNFVVRKAAHFGEYALLGVLGCLAAQSLGGAQPLGGARSAPSSKRARAPKGQWIALTLLVIIPWVDEAIQTQVPGRDGTLSDVLIDIAGGTCGFLIALGLMQGASLAKQFFDPGGDA